MRVIIPFLSLIGIACANDGCRCTPNHPCWPSGETWNALNQTVSGKLIHDKPTAISCYPGPLQDAQECRYVNSQWSNSTFQSLQPVGYCYPTDPACPPVDYLSEEAKEGHCILGPAPVYTINATESEELAAGIAFAQKHNIRLVIRNTGHDILGRSEGYGPLQIWVKYIQKGIIYHERYPNSDWTGAAFTVAGGYTWEDVYPEAFKRNLTVVGGGDPTVGVIGGYTQGGGHSPASRDYGLAADQVLEAKVVLADGSIVTASADQHRDLYFAIRGGGGGTYGVVVSMTIKAHQSESVVAQTLAITPLGDDTDALLDAITDVYASFPSLSDAGYSGYGTWSIASPMPLFGNATVGYTHAIAMMGKTMAEAQDAFAPLLSTLQKQNGTSLFVSVNWLEFPTYGAYYNAMSGAHQPTGTPNSALTSRMFDGDSLTQSRMLLRQMIGVIAGTPDQYTSNNLELVGGGQVFKHDPLSGVDPAWRSTYLVHIVARGWAAESNEEVARSVENDITYVKGGAMKLLTPGSGSYMNEADRNDPFWVHDFYGSHFGRLSEIKRKYDPHGTFFCHTCVGSEWWYQQDLPGEDYGPLCRLFSKWSTALVDIELGWYRKFEA